MTTFQTTRFNKMIKTKKIKKETSILRTTVLLSIEVYSEHKQLRLSSFLECWTYRSSNARVFKRQRRKKKTPDERAKFRAGYRSTRFPHAWSRVIKKFTGSGSNDSRPSSLSLSLTCYPRGARQSFAAERKKKKGQGKTRNSQRDCPTAERCGFLKFLPVGGDRETRDENRLF